MNCRSIHASKKPILVGRHLKMLNLIKYIFLIMKLNILPFTRQGKFLNIFDRNLHTEWCVCVSSNKNIQATFTYFTFVPSQLVITVDTIVISIFHVTNGILLFHGSRYGTREVPVVSRIIDMDILTISYKIIYYILLSERNCSLS